MDHLRGNRLLAALPENDYAQLMPSLEPVEMPLGHSVYESGGVQGYVYFPTSCIVSLLYVLEDGSSAEIAVTGCEGLLGIALFMGGETTPSRAAERCSSCCCATPITQMTQTAVCNRHHTIEQQLAAGCCSASTGCRRNELKMTQELIANMLGVRREGVTEAAGKLEAEGLIEYSRGKIITVLDREHLDEARVCECYAVVKKEYDRLLPAWPATRPPPA